MKINEHAIDRALRVIAGLVLITLAATGTVGMWGWIGVLPLITGVNRKPFPLHDKLLPPTMGQSLPKN